MSHVSLLTGPFYQARHPNSALVRPSALVAISDGSCWSLHIKGAKSKIRCDYDGSHAFAFSYMSKDLNVLDVSYMAVKLVGKVRLSSTEGFCEVISG